MSFHLWDRQRGCGVVIDRKGRPLWQFGQLSMPEGTVTSYWYGFGCMMQPDSFEDAAKQRTRLLYRIQLPVVMPRGQEVAQIYTKPKCFVVDFFGICRQSSEGIPNFV